jgi:DNA (cytosine-5)-methyltransferase 1
VPRIDRNGLTVFSAFCCGGGSTMGYKLAGYDVLGGVEIDPTMMQLYRQNHAPRYSFTMPVQHFATLPDADIPADLRTLDVLDGSPPCSVFSMAGVRQRKWGVTAHFREGDVAQRLDDLFMHFIGLANRLRPRVVVAENVKGLILGKARGYVAEIFGAFRDAGYLAQLFLLNASRMGVPQARERTFFIGRRADLELPGLQLQFTEPLVPVREAWLGVQPRAEPTASAGILRYLLRTAPGESLSSVHPKGSMFNLVRLHADRPAPTVTATCPLYHPQEPRRITGPEAMRLQTFPDDYQALDQDMRYVCGMSVPPYMMQRLALEIGLQLFGRPYDTTRRSLAA